MGLEDLERRFTVGGGQHPVAELAKDLRGMAPERFVVLHDQDAFGADRHGSGPGSSRDDGLVLDGSEEPRKVDLDRRAQSGFAVDPDVA
jgi:hypothetical protein